MSIFILLSPPYIDVMLRFKSSLLMGVAGAVQTLVGYIVPGSGAAEQGPMATALSPVAGEVPSVGFDDLFRERAKYIPLRLSLRERKYLRLLEAALATSEYTTKVDHTQFRNKNRRTHAQLQDICAVMSGLVVACNYKVGQDVIESRNYREHERFFRDIFELGRRHKIMNPGTLKSISISTYLDS